MSKTTCKIGNEVNVEIPTTGTINITPMESSLINADKAAETAKRLIGKNVELFRRLRSVGSSDILQ